MINNENLTSVIANSLREEINVEDRSLLALLLHAIAIGLRSPPEGAALLEKIAEKLAAP